MEPSHGEQAHHGRSDPKQDETSTCRNSSPMGADDDAEPDRVEDLELAAVDDHVVQRSIQGDVESLPDVGAGGHIKSLGQHVIGAHGHGVPPHPGRRRRGNLGGGRRLDRG